MADAHTRRLFDWLNRIAADPEVSPLGFKLAYIIGQHINRETGEAWPTQMTLANMTGATDRGIRKQLAKLNSSGHLLITSGGGRHVANRYRIALNTRNGGSLFAGKNTEPEFLFSNEKPGTQSHKTRNGATSKPGTYVPPEPLNRTTEEQLSRDSLAGHFEEWWHVYPKKVAKEQARRAFKPALKKASVDVLIAGAERYAEERRGQDPRFTKHAATWLNGGCWQDEPQQAHSAHVPAVEAALRYALEDGDGR